MQVELPDWSFAVKVNFRSLICASHSWRWVDWEDDKWERVENRSKIKGFGLTR